MRTCSSCDAPRRPAVRALDPWAAILPVAGAPRLPLVAAGATQLPTKELFEIAKGLSLL